MDILPAYHYNDVLVPVGEEGFPSRAPSTHLTGLRQNEAPLVETGLRMSAEAEG